MAKTPEQIAAEKAEQDKIDALVAAGVEKALKERAEQEAAAQAAAARLAEEAKKEEGYTVNPTPEDSSATAWTFKTVHYVPGQKVKADEELTIELSKAGIITL